MKIELTIKTSYLPTWGAFEGIRELIQNGKDAESEFNAPLVVRHKSDTNSLVIENDGATLPHEALLFGHTTKDGRGDLIGKFGEGLKLGVLALVRAGHAIKIRSGAEVWHPTIERSEKFDADVLVVNIEKGRQPKNRVQVVVSNVTTEDWALMKQCFLFLNKEKQREEFRVETPYGVLLLDEADAGKIFVKGIFVEHDPKIRFGYDLTHDVQVDRDRKMIARYDLEYRMTQIWRDALPRRTELHAKFYEVLNDNKGDVQNISSYNADSLTEEARQQVVTTFKARFGEDAYAVDTVADSKELEFLGKRGVILHKPLTAVLQSIMGTTEQVKRGLMNAVVNHYGWSDLDVTEGLNLESAIALVGDVEKITLADVDVVDFRSENLQGQFKDNRVLLAKKILANRDLTLETLVHEVAHRQGGDGSYSHTHTIECLWSKLVSGLRDRVR